MSITEQIRSRLAETFEPDELVVTDDSESHRGHAGFREGGESHFLVTIRAPAFAGMSRLQRHRAVHDALGRDLLERIHALGLTVRD